MVYELLWVGVGFLLGWLAFERPELVTEHVIEPIKKWWDKL